MGEAVNTADAVAKDGEKPTIVGDPDKWKLLTKYVSGDKSLIVSTKAMEIAGIGCIVQTYRKEDGQISESTVFVPDSKIVHDPTVHGLFGGNYGCRLVADVDPEQ